MAERQRNNLKDERSHEQGDSLRVIDSLVVHHRFSAEHSDVYKASEEHWWQEVAVEKAEVQNCILDESCRHKVPVLVGISRRQSCQEACRYLQVKVDLASFRSLESNHENTEPGYIKQ